MAGFGRKGFGKCSLVKYFGTPFFIQFKQDTDNQIEAGKVILTKTGQQLALICGATPVDGFVEYVLAKWIEQGLVVYSPYPKWPD